jgi:hypothetical protein
LFGHALTGLIALSLQKLLGGTTIVSIGHHSPSQTTKKRLPEPLFSGTLRIVPSNKITAKSHQIRSALCSSHG